MATHSPAERTARRAPLLATPAVATIAFKSIDGTRNSLTGYALLAQALHHLYQAGGTVLPFAVVGQTEPKSTCRPRLPLRRLIPLNEDWRLARSCLYRPADLIVLSSKQQTGPKIRTAVKAYCSPEQRTTLSASRTPQSCGKP